MQIYGKNDNNEYALNLLSLLCKIKLTKFEI